MSRTQFTFYASFREAVQGLKDADRLRIYEAIIDYALLEQESTALNGVCKLAFTLVKPTLDTSRKRAYAGKQGGSKPQANPKQNGSKPQANPKLEIGVDIERERERDIDRGVLPDDDACAHTHEGGGSEFASTEQFYEELKEELLSETTTANQLQMQYGKQRGELLRYLDTFQRSQRIEMNTHSSRGDYRKHFNSWLRIQVAEGQSPDQSQPKQTKYLSETEKIKHNADNIDPNRAGYSDF